MTKESRKAKYLLILILIPIVLLIIGGRYIILIQPKTIEIQHDNYEISLTVNEYLGNDNIKFPSNYKLDYFLDEDSLIVTMNNTEATRYKYQFRINFGENQYNVSLMQYSFVHNTYIDITYGSGVSIQENLQTSSEYIIRAVLKVSKI